MKDNDELYKLIKDTIINLQNDNISFDQYLEVQSKFISILCLICF